MTYDEAAAWEESYREMVARWAKCDLELSQARHFFPATPGDVREAAAFVTCAAEPCDTDATTEMLHAPGDGSALWVPLCEFHLTVGPTSGFAYIAEAHGFVPPIHPD